MGGDATHNSPEGVLHAGRIGSNSGTLHSFFWVEKFAAAWGVT